MVVTSQSVESMKKEDIVLETCLFWLNTLKSSVRLEIHSRPRTIHSSLEFEQKDNAGI